jgi:hypothetical protein
MKFNSLTVKTIFFIALNFLAVNNLFAQADKAWFKPKVYAESYKLDRDSCATPGQSQTGYNNCMGQRGWTLVDRNILNADRKFCQDKSSSLDDSEKRSVYLSCLLEKGWDEENDTQYKTRMLSREFAEACKLEEHKLFNSKAPCEQKDITLQHLADASFINEQEKIAMLAFVKTADQIERKRLDAFRTGGMLEKKLYEYRLKTSNPKIDEIRLSLLTGKINFGEFNKRRKELATEASLASQKFSEEVREFSRQPPPTR